MKDSMTSECNASNAQLVQDHPLTTRAVSMLTATLIKSTEAISFAHNVNGAHQEPYQTQPEDSALSSQDHQPMSMEDQLVTNTLYSLWIRKSALSAQATSNHHLII